MVHWQKHTEETKAKIGAANSGKKPSPETLAKRCISQKLAMNRPDVIARLADSIERRNAPRKTLMVKLLKKGVPKSKIAALIGVSRVTIWKWAKSQ